MANLRNAEKCPSCGSSWNGGSIYDTFRKNPHYDNKTDEELKKLVEESYSPPYTWGRQVGIELAYDDPKHYDGVSIWHCPDCDMDFDRWTGEELGIVKRGSINAEN